MMSTDEKTASNIGFMVLIGRTIIYMDSPVYHCPECGSQLDVHYLENKFFSSVYMYFECKKCGYSGTEAKEAEG
ncbi:MAG: hypothetical protein HY518_02285 [Candidatus Aenigmarchaeota archaeon]|nr:hypothetical protein [Candidatus Aenigmarchaeota archaeon]